MITTLGKDLLTDDLKFQLEEQGTSPHAVLNFALRYFRDQGGSVADARAAVERLVKTVRYSQEDLRLLGQAIDLAAGMTAENAARIRALLSPPAARVLDAMMLSVRHTLDRTAFAKHLAGEELAEWALRRLAFEPEDDLPF